MLLFLFPFDCEGEQSQGHCVSTWDQGSFNWSSGKVRAYGKASPQKDNPLQSADAVLGGAKADASRKLIAVLKAIRLNGSQSVGDVVASNEKMMAGIEKTAMDAVLVEQHYTSDCAMQVTLETSIYGGFLQLVLPDDIREIPKIDSIKIKKKKNAEDTKIGLTMSEPYTGLVLDARGIDFEPVLYPMVVSELGDTVYGPVFITREVAVQQGLCSYLCSMDLPQITDRAGINPMMIKGLRKGGENNSSIVISKSDAQKIEKATEFHTFMRECRIVIIVD